MQIITVDISTLQESAYQRLYALASPERRQRADRYLRNEDRHRCIVADGLMRYVLGSRYAKLELTPKGKPFLPGHEDLHFNLSHSGHWVVIAWGNAPLGIDVEMMCTDRSKEPLARRFFHPNELDYLLAAIGQEWVNRFFEIWTKKESYLKYLGTGIDRALNSFSVLDTQDVAFHTQFLEDAALTLCAQDPRCQILTLPPELLLQE